MHLSLQDLKPAETSFTLAECPGKTYVLRKFSLAERIWLNQRFGNDKVKSIFETQSLPEMAEITHHLLKDASDFPTFMDFAKSVVTMQDQVNLTTALLGTIGIDDKLIQRLAKESEASLSPNVETPQS